MQTFSIAVGSYTLPDKAAMIAGAQSVMRLGGDPPDINTVEAQQAKEAAEVAKLVAAQAAGPQPPPGGQALSEPAAEPDAPKPQPMHIGAGDTVEFGVNPGDYSVCILTAHHPDGSNDWIKVRRNGFLIESGYTPAPPPPNGGEETTAAASPVDNIDVPPEDPPAEEEFSGSHSGRGHRNKRGY